MSHSKQKEGNDVKRRVPAPRQRATPFRARHHCASGKIQVGYIGPSAVQSGPRARRFPLVSRLKNHLAGKKFDDDDEVQEEVMTWFKGQAADFYGSGIQKLVPRLNKCLDNAGYYVEK